MFHKKYPKSSKTTSFSVRSETNGDSWMVYHLLVWQPSYQRSLQYSRAIPWKNSNHRIHTVTLWKHVYGHPVMQRHPMFVKEDGNDKLWICYWLSVSLERIQIDGGDLMTMIIMKLWWPWKSLGYQTAYFVSNSNKDLSWFIKFLYTNLALNTTIKSITSK
jgi:hypothetical protein